jgi:hypothetical protein
MLATTALSFIGCGDDVVEIFTKDKPVAMTITITTIYDDYDPQNEKQVEALLQVQHALNQITETKFNTHVVIQPMKSEDYMNQILSMSEQITAEVEAEKEALDALLQQKKDALRKDPNKKKGQQAKLTNADILKVVGQRKYASKYSVIGKGFETAANNDSVYKDALGRYQTMYPSVTKDGVYADAGKQLDIVLINSSEMYNTMVDKGYLFYLNSEFLGNNTVSNQLIQKYVNQAVYDYIDIGAGSEMYAIPNNTVYGEYGTILVNKALFDEYGYDINFDYNPITAATDRKVDDFSDLENFIKDVMNDSSKSGYKPVLNNPNLDFLSYYGKQSLMINEMVSKYNTDVVPALRCITTSTLFQSHFRTMYQLTKLPANRQPVSAEWLTAEDIKTTYKDEKFAVAFVKGNIGLLEEFGGTEEKPGDYYVVASNLPFVGENAYESMYGISSCINADPLTADTRKARCYQILELFSTNPQWVNLLTYGVEGEHFEFSAHEPGVVVNRNENYTFDRKYAGNLFLQYYSDDMPAELKAYAANNWELAKLQNQKLVISPYAGFMVKTQGKNVETGEIEDLVVGKDKDAILVSEILKNWATVEATYYARLYNGNQYSFADYEAYIQANPGTTMDDYFKAFREELMKEKAYEDITSSRPYSPASQYSDFFFAKRDGN